jgi:hypothetical protein
MLTSYAETERSGEIPGAPPPAFLKGVLNVLDMFLFFLVVKFVQLSPFRPSPSHHAGDSLSVLV